MGDPDDSDASPADDRPPVVGPAAEPSVEVQHDFADSTAELTVTVIDAVATARDVSPTEVVPRVSDRVDPDALDRIFRPLPDGNTRQGRVAFELLDCLVVIDGDGTVRVYNR